MPKLYVSEIAPERLDETHSKILCVYAISDPLFAVYRTESRVAVQFADDVVIQQRQRADFASLAPLRGEINGLVDGWRGNADPNLADKAKRYDRNVADALVVALTRDVASAQAILQQIRDELLADRTSLAKLMYLVFAFCTSILFILGSSFGASMAAPGIGGFWGNTDLLWMAAGAGSVGAFFSITLAVHTRQFKPEQQFRDDLIAAVVRVVIGAIAGTLLVALLCTSMFKFELGGLKLGGCPPSANTPCAPAILPLVIVAFIGGFAERLVPDLLRTVSATLDKNVVPAVPPRPAGGTRAAIRLPSESERPAQENEPQTDKGSSDVKSDGN